MSDDQAESSPVQSVDRAIEILELLAARGELGITELAAQLGVHKSTSFRLASALERRGLVEQSRGRGGYRLGFGLLRLAGAMSGQLELTQQARPVSIRLADQLGETVNIAVLDRGAAVNIDQVLGRGSLTTHNWVGQRTPLHATSSGKVLLAYLPASELDTLVSQGLDVQTQYTVVEPSVLLRELAAVRSFGFAATVEELELGLNAVAAPIRGPGGRVIAAISVSGPSSRLSAGQVRSAGDGGGVGSGDGGEIPAAAAAVRVAAAEISTLMGYVG